MKQSLLPHYLAHSQSVVDLQTQAKYIDTPRLVISDFDGTLFTPDMRIVHEILFQNKKLTKILHRKHIPLVINTSRHDWLNKAKLHTQLLGIYPDTIIAGAGTIIYHKNNQGQWNLDTEWNDVLKKSWNDNHITSRIEDVVTKWQNEQKITLEKKLGSTFQIRYTIRNVETLRLPGVITELQKQFSSEIKVVYAESLFSNRFGYPTGDMLIIPDCAGKDNALKYLLDKYSLLLEKPIEALCFGDGASDLTSFLTMPTTSNYTFKQFLIHPTTLAKHLYDRIAPSHKPKCISKTGSGTIINILQEQLAPSQRNILRKYLSEPFKYLLDKIYPAHLSANDITMEGLIKVIEAVDSLYKPKILGVKPLLQYGLGLYADIADGIRARQTYVTKTGKLADDFADRVREFYQLYIRGKRRLAKNPEQALATFEAGISCILTGLIRREAELKDIFFDEGPTLSRSKKLFLSLVHDSILKNHKKSMQIDEEILVFSTNVYLKRSKKVAPFKPDQINTSTVTEFQKKTLERWLLCVQLLQEEHAIVMQTLPKNIHKKYQDWLHKLNLNHYIEDVNIQKIRQKYHFEDYFFTLKKYERYFK